MVTLLCANEALAATVATAATMRERFMDAFLGVGDGVYLLHPLLLS
jgi:hypothetical protein